MILKFNSILWAKEPWEISLTDSSSNLRLIFWKVFVYFKIHIKKYIKIPVLDFLLKSIPIWSWWKSYRLKTKLLIYPHIIFLHFSFDGKKSEFPSYLGIDFKAGYTTKITQSQKYLWRFNLFCIYYVRSHTFQHSDISIQPWNLSFFFSWAPDEQLICI